MVKFGLFGFNSIKILDPTHHDGLDCPNLIPNFVLVLSIQIFDRLWFFITVPQTNERDGYISNDLINHLKKLTNLK